MTLWRGEEGNTYEVDLDYFKLQSRFLELSELISKVAIDVAISHDKEARLWFSHLCETADAMKRELQERVKNERN